MKSIEEKRREFWRLHESGCFAIPNPWDIGTAKYLQHLGFKAIATTSAGFAFSRGLSDGAVKRADNGAHIKEFGGGADISGNGGYGKGYANQSEDGAGDAEICGS